MERISTEQVCAQIQKFWNILSGKSKGNLEELYAHDAIVFSGKAKRSEPAQLAIARRERHLSGPASEINAEVAQIDVQVIGDVAIASYTYRFNEARSARDGGRLEKKTLYGRATQIFRRDDKGALRIVHEHLSAGEAPAVGKPQSGATS